MSNVAFTTCLTIAGALLALWLDVRIGDARPAGVLRRFGHAAFAFLLLEAATASLYYAKTAGLAPSGLMIAVLLLFAPALVYAFVAGIWLMRMLADIARLARR